MLKPTPTLALLLTLVSPLAAQDRSADEQAIRSEVRKLEARTGEVKGTKDSVFWTGAFVSPVVGAEKPVPRPGSSADGKRINDKTSIKINQLHVSASGDMAYEYSTVHSSWDRTDNKQHIELDAAVLRVWQKENGQWRIAAMFQRPIENTPTTR